ncbi:MAG: hypothetical protein ACRC9P_09490 [Bacteroides sp.]
MNKNALIWSHLFLAAILVVASFFVEENYLRRGCYLSAIGIAYMVVRKSNVDDMASRGWLDDIVSMLLVAVACFSLSYLFFAPCTFALKCMAAAVLGITAIIGIRRIKIRHFSNKLEELEELEETKDLEE